MSECEWPRPWTYEEVTRILGSVLKFGINPSLEPVRALCEALGRPQDTLSVVQITGTNGKTSTARLTAAILSESGTSTGLYTSPELERYPERIAVDGAISSDAQFARAVGVAADTARALWGESASGVPAGITEFEILTAASLWHFREAGVEAAVLEVGMGGRWDATSVTLPTVSVITGVGLDHTHILGATVEAIAAEKAAIIRPGSVAVLGPGTSDNERVFLAHAENAGARSFAVRETGKPSPVPDEQTVRYTIRATPDAPDGVSVLDVFGIFATYSGLELAAPAYQAANLATAVATAEVFLGSALDQGQVHAAVANATLPGRFELMRRKPPIIVDGSHNPQAARVLAEAISNAWPDKTARPLVLLGVLADKDAAGIVAELAGAAGGFAVATPDSPRALAARELASVVLAVTGEKPAEYGNVASAAVSLAADPASRTGLVVTGSLTTAGQARAALRDTSATST